MGNGGKRFLSESGAFSQGETVRCQPPSMLAQENIKTRGVFSGCLFGRSLTSVTYRNLSDARQHLSQTIALCDTVPGALQSILTPHHIDARLYSEHFPEGHRLNTAFVRKYQLEDELGSGGYGFVMTAIDQAGGQEVAVKFIIKEKVPDHAWMEDEDGSRLPTEVVILNYVKHETIVRCLDIFEDPLYFYLVQELHGTPWHKDYHLSSQNCANVTSPDFSTPLLSPSASEASLPSSEPATPPSHAIEQTQIAHSGDASRHIDLDMPKLLQEQLMLSSSNIRPEINRRASHDLFECIEQSEHKRLTEDQARYVFSQVAEVVEYLDKLGIAHRDIKDENLVIDQHFKVKLIDFGSAIAVDPAEPRPYHDLFYGTAAYASAEILHQQKYKAAPAEIWTLGVLLSYLLCGVSPFPSTRDAAEGRIFLSERVVGDIPEDAMDLMRRCLHPDPELRATITEVLSHSWLQRGQSFPSSA